MKEGQLKPTGSQIAYSIALISEHNQNMHDEKLHQMCRLCQAEEAKLLDQLKDKNAD